MDNELQNILRRCDDTIWQINLGISRISRSLTNKSIDVRNGNIIDACNSLRLETQHIQDIVENVSEYAFQDWGEIRLYDNEYKELYMNVNDLMRHLFMLYRYYETEKPNKDISEIDNIICPSNIIEIYTLIENING
jgi:hypothetical protein